MTGPRINGPLTARVLIVGRALAGPGSRVPTHLEATTPDGTTRRYWPHTATAEDFRAAYCTARVLTFWHADN